MKAEVELVLNMRGLRKEAHVSLNSVAELSGIHKSILARIETGALPSLSNALRLARFLQTPVEEIWALKNCENHG